MNNSQKSGDVSLVFAVAALISPITPSALAQDLKSTETWRPKDGIYVVDGKTIAERCADSTEFYADLREKSVGGNEWSCKVRKLTDKAPGTIRLDMTCSDYNLAEFLKKPEETEFREVMLLKKMDGNSMLVQKTVDGKFKDPKWKAVYCPSEAQQMYRDSKARDRQEAERKATMKSSAPEPAKW